MKKCDLVADFMKKLNVFLKFYNKDQLKNESDLDTLKTKIEEIKRKLSDSENILAKTRGDKINKREETNIKYNQKDGKITQITADNLLKHKFSQPEPIKITCKHEFNNFACFFYKKTKFCTTREDFILDRSSYYLVDVFSHFNKTCRGYVCFISLLDDSGTLYIIDALKLRNELLESGFFECHYKKVFTSRIAYYKCLQDFKNISCFGVINYNNTNYNFLDNSSSFNTEVNTNSFIDIDWRIRPIDKYMKFILQLSIVQHIQLINQFFNTTRKNDLVFEESQEEKCHLGDFVKISFLNKLRKINLNQLLTRISKMKILNAPSIINDTRTKIVSGVQFDINNTGFNIIDVQKPINPQTDGEILLLGGDRKIINDITIDFIKSNYKIEVTPYLIQFIEHRDYIAMDHDESIYQVLDNETLVKIYKLQPVTYGSLKELETRMGLLAKIHFDGFLFVKENVDRKKVYAVDKSKSFFSNNDIRGCPLERQKKQWTRKPKVPDKFVYTEDSSDYEYTEIKKDKTKTTKNHKIIHKKSKKLEALLDTLTLENKKEDKKPKRKQRKKTICKLETEMKPKKEKKKGGKRNNKP